MIIKFNLIIFIFLSNVVISFSQNFRSYFTGNNIDKVIVPEKGICLMGGATENDEAMKWFLERAKGGDILVLRTSGSNGYNDYLYSELGVLVNSVETIVCNNKDASFDDYVLQKIAKAEGIWFAGGNQWNYINFWKGTPVDSIINEKIINENIVIGGTSAGMAILGGYRFSAENGTINSNDALNNPYHEKATIDFEKFLELPLLSNIITDTHYDNPDRKGRHMAFIAKILKEGNDKIKGIACDEYTAVCIDKEGIAKIFGGYPEFDDNAYFIQVNCEESNNLPENCEAGQKLNWNINENAVKAYKVKGTLEGTNFFDLNNWEEESGGEWLDWYVIEGIFLEKGSDEINCFSSTKLENKTIFINLTPNPVSEKIKITCNEIINFLTVYDVSGKQIIQMTDVDKNSIEIDLSTFKNGFYSLKVISKLKHMTSNFIKL